VTPVVTFEHDLGGTSVVSSIAYSAPRERVMIGNRNGEIGWYSITGVGAPLSQKVVVPQLETGMQVRDIRAEPDGGVWVALGGFSGPRRGLVLSMDFTGPDASIVSVQPVASIGLTKPAFAVDSSRSIIYSNAVVNTGDSLGIADQRRYRIPLFRGYHEVRHEAAHCP
jgi:hypothetical protein